MKAISRVILATLSAARAAYRDAIAPRPRARMHVGEDRLTAMTSLIPGVLLVLVLAACGGTTTTSAAPSPRPDPAASVLYNALTAASSKAAAGVSRDPALLATYAKVLCTSLNVAIQTSLQTGQGAYQFLIATLEKKGYTLVQARAVMHAVIYGYCPQVHQLTNTPAH